MNEASNNIGELPISDILTEIRQLVSDETNKRYSRDRDLALTELLILRPETRVDVVLQEPDIPSAGLVPENIATSGLGVSSKEELRDLIREILVEELSRQAKKLGS